MPLREGGEKLALLGSFGKPGEGRILWPDPISAPRLFGAAVAAVLFSKVRPEDFGAALSPGKLSEQLLPGSESTVLP